MSNRFQYQNFTEPVAPTISAKNIPSWFRQWTDPVRYAIAPAMAVALAAPFLAFTPPQIASASQTEFYTQLSEPVRTAPRDAWFQASAQTHAPPYAETVTESRWHQPLSEPVRVAPRDAWFQDNIGIPPQQPVVVVVQQTAPTFPVDYGVFPEFRLQYQAYTIAPEGITVQQTAPVAPVDVSIQLERRFQYQSRAYLEAPPFPETVSDSRWHQPWSEPVRVPPRDVWFQPHTLAPNPVVSFSYYQPLSEPVRVAPRDVWFQPDTLTRTQSDVTGIKYTPLSEPVRTAPRDAWYQPDVLGRAAPFPEEVSEDRWHQPWSEPVRVAARTAWYQDNIGIPPQQPAAAVNVITGISPVDYGIIPEFRFQYQTYTAPVTTPAAAVVTVQAVSLADVTIQLERRVQYQSATGVVTTTFPETVTESRWHQPWSEPIRVAPRDAWFQPETSFSPFPIPNQAVVLSMWFEPWQDPVRVLPRDVWFQPDALGRAAPFPEEVSEDRWHQPWSDPVRTAPRDAWFQDNIGIPPQQSQQGNATQLQSWEPYVDPVRLPFPVAVYDPWLEYLDTVDLPPTDVGKVWRRYWIQDDPQHSINRDAPHDLVWAEEDEIAILIGLL